MGTAPTDDEPTLRSFASQRLMLRYVDWGNGGAPTLLLIHGTRDHARSWDWTARALRDRWHVVAVDLRGHGDSDWSADGAYLLPYYLLDLVALFETLGTEPVTVVAHSFGGTVVSRYAGLYPDRIRRIAFVDSLGPDPSTYVQWAEAGPMARSHRWIGERRDPRQASPRRFATIEEAAGRMLAANPHLSPEQATHLATHGVRRHADGYGWKYDPRVGMFAPEDFAVQGSHYWQAITAPALLLHGKRSWTSDPAEDGRAAFFRDARTVTFDDAGHWIHHDRFDRFLAELDAFL